MNDLMNLTTLTMSSLEIATLVESRHDNVKKSIERLVEKGVIKLPTTVIPEKINNLGLPQKTKTYNLEKRDSFVVVAQLSPGFIGRIVDSWGRTEDSLKELLEALEAFDVPEECADMFVYAIREEDTGRVKLGISRDPHERVKQLQTGNSSTLRLLAYRRATNGVADERQLHHDAADYHIRGEWFSCGEEVLQ